MPEPAEQQRILALISQLERALRESYRIKESAEALSRASQELAQSTPPERRTKPRKA